MNGRTSPLERHLRDLELVQNPDAVEENSHYRLTYQMEALEARLNGRIDKLQKSLDQLIKAIEKNNEPSQPPVIHNHNHNTNNQESIFSRVSSGSDPREPMVNKTLTMNNLKNGLAISRHMSGDFGFDYEEEEPSKAFDTLGFILSPSSRLLLAFNVVFMLFVLYEALIISATMSTGFHWFKFPTTWGLALDIIITIFCFIYVWLHFHTAVMDGPTLVDDELQLIASIYLKSWFAFDCLSAFPLDLIVLPFSVFGYRICQSIRFLRIIRVMVKFRTYDVLNERPKLMRIGFLSFGVVLASHIITCFWMVIGMSDDDRDLPANASESKMISVSVHMYIMALYWAQQTLTSVGYGDIFPANDYARLYAILIMFLGVTVQSIIMAHFWTVLLEQNDPVVIATREKRKKLASMLKYYEVPWEDQKAIFTIFPHLLKNAVTEQMTAEIISVLPQFMQDKITLHIKIKLLRAVSLFTNASIKCLHDVAQVMKHQIVPSKYYIINAGTIGEEVFFLASGMVEIIVKEQAEEKVVTTLREGAAFGEIALLLQVERTASVRSIVPCVLYRLHKRDLDPILKNHPDFQQVLQREMERKMADVLKAEASLGRRMTRTTNNRITNPLQPTGKVSITVADVDTLNPQSGGLVSSMIVDYQCNSEVDSDPPTLVEVAAWPSSPAHIRQRQSVIETLVEAAAWTSSPRRQSVMSAHYRLRLSPTHKPKDNNNIPNDNTNTELFNVMPH